MVLNYENMIVSGNFNAYNVAWGYMRTDNMEMILIEQMQTKRLEICNESGNLQTYHILGLHRDMTRRNI